MRVVVVGNVAHVVVNLPAVLPEKGVGDGGQLGVQVRFHVVGGLWVVHRPDHHRHEADLAVSNPAGLVLEVATSDGRRFAEIAVAHFFT